MTNVHVINELHYGASTNLYIYAQAIYQLKREIFTYYFKAFKHIGS